MAEKTRTKQGKLMSLVGAVTLGLAGLGSLVSGGCMNLPTEEQYDKYFEEIGNSMQDVAEANTGIERNLAEKWYGKEKAEKWYGVKKD